MRGDHRQCLFSTQLIIPLFNFCFDQAWGRVAITGNRVRPGEVTQAPRSLKAILLTPNFPSRKSFLSFLGTILVLISDSQRQLNFFALCYKLLNSLLPVYFQFSAHMKGLGHISLKKKAGYSPKIKE